MTSLRSIAVYLSGPLVIAILTAVTTLLLILLLSAVIGGESRERAEQTRCYAALSNAMIHDLLDNAGIENSYPRVDAAGLDCTFITEPVEP